jgi:hypothetical protein
VVVFFLLLLHYHSISSVSTLILVLLLFLWIVDSKCHCINNQVIVPTACQINKNQFGLVDPFVDYLSISLLTSVDIDCIVSLSWVLTPLQCTVLDSAKMAKQILPIPSAAKILLL